MPIITLTSDWKNGDFYIGSIKGRLLSQFPDIQIIDITHNIAPFSIVQASFVIKNVYKNFPDNTIHIIAVDTEPTSKESLILVRAENQYFLSKNNGIFGLIFDEETIEAYELQLQSEIKSFSTFTIFCQTAIELIEKKPVKSIGKPLKNINKKVPILPTINEDTINGSIVYVDSYKNAISNISFDLFNKVGKNRRFEIFIQSNSYKVNKINKKYSETSVGELLALFNSVNLLEIALNKGDAATLLNLNQGSAIRVKFYK